MPDLPPIVQPETITIGQLVVFEEDGDSMEWLCDSYLSTPDGSIHLQRLGEIVMTLGPDDYYDVMWVPQVRCHVGAPTDGA